MLDNANNNFDAATFTSSFQPQQVRFRVGIIGAGRLGRVIGSALRACGHEIYGYSTGNKSNLEAAEAMLPGVAHLPVRDIVAGSELLILTVSDDSLGPVIAELASEGLLNSRHFLVHMSGARGLDVFEPAIKSGALYAAIHPTMAFTGTSVDIPRLQGCPFAITAPPLLVPIATALVLDLGGRPFIIDNADRALYHAALSHAANHMVTILSQSMQLLSQIGVPDPAAVLEPVMTASLQNTLDCGPAALTGPISRGDEHTLRAHLGALDLFTADKSGNFNRPKSQFVGESEANDEPEFTAADVFTPAEISAAYRYLAAASTKLALHEGRISELTADELLSLLAEK